MSNRRFYWLKLKEDFFEDDTIQWLEEQENGKDYVIFYLKLCLRSLSDDGILVRFVGEKLIPYDIKALAKLTNTALDTVAVAMKTFLEIGLINQLESGEIYMNQINEMIGTETDSARRMRKKRAKQGIETDVQRNNMPSHCDTDVQKSDIEKEREKELDKEIDIEQEKEKEQITSSTIHRFYQDNFGVASSYIIEDLHQWIDDLSPDLVLLALKKAIEKNAEYSYAKGIMKNWAKKGIKSLEDAEAEGVARARQTGYQNNSHQRTETEPAWVNDPESQNDEKLSPEEEQAIRERMARIRARKGAEE